MSVEVILRYENENIEVFQLPRRESIKRMVPGLIEFETEETSGAGADVRKEKKTIVFSGGLYTVVF